MSYTLTHESDTKKSLNITLSSAEIEQKFDEAAVKARPRLHMNGFRQGKVPLDMARKVFRKELLSDAVNDLIQATMSAAAEEQQLRIVDVNVPEIKEKLDGYLIGADLQLTADIEVVKELPEIDLSDVVVKDFFPAIDDQQIDQRIEFLRSKHAVLTPVEDRRTPVAGDMVTADVTLAFLDAPDATPQKEENLDLVVGDREQENLPFPAIMDLIEKAEKDAPVEEDVVTPEDDKVRATVLIKEIKTRSLPEVNEEFIANYGSFADMTAFRAWVREQVAFMRRTLGGEMMFEQIVDAIAVKYEFDIPESLSNELVDEILKDEYPNLSKLLESNPEKLTYSENRVMSNLLKDVKEKAAKRFKGSEVFRVLRKQLDVNITDADVDAHIEKLADLYNQPVPKVKSRYKNPELWKSEALFDALLAKVSEFVTFEYITHDDHDECDDESCDCHDHGHDHEHEDPGDVPGAPDRD